MCLMKFLYFFTKGQTAIIILSQKNYQTSLRVSLNILGENTEKCKIFSISIEKEVTKIDNNINESVVTVAYKIKFIDSARFMESSLSNLNNNLAEEILKMKCKDRDCFLEYESIKDNLIKIVHLIIKII